MEIQKTSVIETGDKSTVEILIADNADPSLAKECLSLRVVVPSDLNPLFAALQKVALQRVQQLVSAQIQKSLSRSNQ
jgi:hypothetical protein